MIASDVLVARRGAARNAMCARAGRRNEIAMRRWCICAAGQGVRCGAKCDDYHAPAQPVDRLMGAPRVDYSAEDLGDRTYDELRRVVARQVHGGADGKLLDATDIVHEVWVRMSNQDSGWSDRVHFQAVASMFARRVIVDAARTRSARKRGGDRRRVGLDLASAEVLGTHSDAIEIDDALQRLAELDERQSMIAEHRIFGGSTTECIARMLDVSEATVRRDWAVARAWLRATLADERSADPAPGHGRAGDG